MKTLAIGSFFVLFAIVALAATPIAYGDHGKATVSMPEGSNTPGCEETNECFIPSDVTVDVGGTVTWTNDDSIFHTVDNSTAVKLIESGPLSAGTTFEVTFDEAGDYPYYCAVHPHMVGTVTVTAEEPGDDAMTDDDAMMMGDDDDAMTDDDAMMMGDDDDAMTDDDAMMMGDDDDAMTDDDAMMMGDDDDAMTDDDAMMMGDDDDAMTDDDAMMMGDDDDTMMMGDDDDTMMMGDDGMMMMEDGTAGMISDGTKVKIHASAPTAGETMEIKVEFGETEHANYDVIVTQNGETVLEKTAAHEHEGVGTHTTDALVSADPVDVTVTFQGYGVADPKTGPIGETVTFTNIVPEFGTIATMILAVAIVSIIAVTARTKLGMIPRV